MATITINGNDYTLPEGETLNAIQAAHRFGIEIPYYCWHPALSVVANCRMCEVQVGSRDAKTGEVRMIPKMVPGCQTPAKDGTVIVTDSEAVKQHQAMIMEYLLINHPLDCPVCDQAGQCGLQDYSYRHGQANHRFVEERNVNPRKEVSDQIQLNQDRCIMCTRCVRFTREITHTAELQVIRRGSHAEIDTFPGEPVDNPLAGNVVDLCPVGALLDKDFLHKQRYWFLDQHESVCTRCSTGCNITAEENRGAVWRFRARYNPRVNDFWICDEGRASYKSANDRALLPAMYLRDGGGLRETPVPKAIAKARDLLSHAVVDRTRVLGVLSPFLTVEEAYLVARLLRSTDPKAILALGPVPSEGEDQTFTPDSRKGRTGDTSFISPRPFTIHAEKCPNRRGIELVLRHFQKEVIPFVAAKSRLAAGEFGIAWLTGCGLEASFTQADSDAIRPGVATLIVQDVWPTPLAQVADIVLNGATFAEKAGCYVNANGRLQYAGAIIPPRDGSVPDLDLLAILLERQELGPIASRSVLQELAEVIPAFSAVRSGEVAEFGLQLEGEEAPMNPMPEYAEPWHSPRGRPTPTLDVAH